MRPITSLVLVFSLILAAGFEVSPALAQPNLAGEAATDSNPWMKTGSEASMKLAGSVYSVQDLGTLGGGSTYARAVNSSGTVTGWSNLGAGLMYEQAYKWQSGLMEALPVLGGNPALSIGYSINTAGQVAGYSSSSGSTSRAVLWSNTGIATDLGTLGGWKAAALHVNDNGQTAGWSEFSTDSGERRAVIWSSGGISALAAGGNFDEALSINNAGTAVGECITIGDTSTVTQPCAWPGGVLAVLGGSQGSAKDINEAGTIVGWAETSQVNHLGGKIPHAALWDAGGVHDLGTLPGNKVSRANAINTQGQVVGAASIINELATSPTHAVQWENGQIYDLNDRIPAGAGWVLGEAYGINDEGQIVGTGVHNGVGSRAFLLTPATHPVVTLDGPGASLKGQTYTFNVTTATLDQPVTYTWTATDQTDFSEIGGLTSTHDWSWADTGSKVVGVTATSAMGDGTTVSHPIDIGDVLVKPSGSAEEINYTFAPNRTITITIPAGAAPSGTELLFTALPQPSETTGYTFAGISFKLDAYVDGQRQTGFVFSQPVTVTMSFAAGDLAGLDESAIILYYQAGPSWVDTASTCQPASQYVRNLAQHTLSVGVCHLSTFATWVFNGSRLFLPVIMKN